MSVTEKITDSIYMISDGEDLFVRAFLITGEGRNILIDTGVTRNGVYDEVKKISADPTEVYLTHGDIDHAGGLEQFGECHVHQADIHMIGSGIRTIPVNEGDKVSVGSFCFEVIEIPGHTNGSIAFFDKEKGLLISGDTVQRNGVVFMFGKERDPEKYLSSLKKLSGYTKDINIILPSHGELPLAASAVEDCINDAFTLFRGNADGAQHPFMPCRVFKGKTVSFYY